MSLYFPQKNVVFLAIYLACCQIKQQPPPIFLYLIVSHLSTKLYPLGFSWPLELLIAWGEELLLKADQYLIANFFQSAQPRKPKLSLVSETWQASHWPSKVGLLLSAQINVSSSCFFGTNDIVPPFRKPMRRTKLIG